MLHWQWLTNVIDFSQCNYLASLGSLKGYLTLVCVYEEMEREEWGGGVVVDMRPARHVESASLASLPHTSLTGKIASANLDLNSRRCNISTEGGSCAEDPP